MTLTKEQVREMFPEMAAIVDQVRATGGTVQAAWVEDEEGIVLAGRRPPGEHRWAEVDHWPEDVQRAVSVPEKVRAPRKVGRPLAIRGKRNGR